MLAALLPLIRQGKVVLEMPDDGRYRAFCQSIKDFQPQLVFLSGHGIFHDDPIDDNPATAWFQFEDDLGRPDNQPAAKIADAFFGATVQCVVLSACESGKTSSEQINAGLVQHLAELGLPYVLGMRESVLDAAGHLFAHRLCSEIGNAATVVNALQSARQALAEPPKSSGKTALTGLNELIKSQWSLPLLVAKHPHHPLIDWRFTPVPKQYKPLNQSINNISLPARFIGRRTELRSLHSQLKSQCQQLLITGSGGQGKTALAGKIAQNLEHQGVALYAYSARANQSMLDFATELQQQLKGKFLETYESQLLSTNNQYDKAHLLLNLLLQQQRTTDPNGQILLFIDNLESLQHPVTHALTEPKLAQWVEAAQALSQDGLLLLLTSRWQLPDWPSEQHWPLQPLSYQDFLRPAQEQDLPLWLLQQPGKMKTLHQTLHGNGRGLAFFTAAIAKMTQAQEAAFEQTLKTVTEELQTDMALSTITEYLDHNEITLLCRMTAYTSPVPLDGVIKIAIGADIAVEDKPDVTAVSVEKSLQRLLQCSLLEQQYSHQLQCDEYRCSPIVADWLAQPDNPLDGAALSDSIFALAAAYQQYLFNHDKHTFEQAIVVYQALVRAKQTEEAYGFALDYIVESLTRAGFYQTLLSDWLPDIRQAQTAKIKGEVLNQTGTLHHHLGQFDTALDYLKRALTIAQDIGDKAGEGSRLNNISQIYHAKGDYDTTLDYLKRALSIMQDIGNKTGEGTTLNNISQIYDAKGDYDSALDYLKRALTIAQDIGDKAGEGIRLNNISQVFKAQGYYNNALDYLKRALSIMQDIGDEAGLCVTLFNIGHIHWQNNQQQEAFTTWIRVYQLAKSMGLAQALGELENLAERIDFTAIGLPPGLEGWEALSQSRGSE